MRHEAMKMIAALPVTGIIATAISSDVPPLVVAAVASYVMWCVAKGFGG